MSPESRDRTTFLSIREIVERLRRILTDARDALAGRMRADGGSERARIFVETLERLSVDLDASLDETTADAPREVLDTRAQYTTDALLEDVEPPAVGDSVEDATAWLLSVDRSVADAISALAARTDGSEVRTYLDALAQLLTAHDRQLARVANEDVDT